MISLVIEVAIIAIIIIGIGVVIWKGGAANPVGTGTLEKEFARMNREFDLMEDEVRDQGKAIVLIGERLETMEAKYAKVSDIKRLERSLTAHDSKMNEMREQLATIREDVSEGKAQQTAANRQIDMIYEVIVKKGMNS